MVIRAIPHKPQNALVWPYNRLSLFVDMTEDIHQYRKRIEAFEKKLRTSPNVSEADFQLIQDYKRHSLLAGITEGRVARHLFDLHRICEWLECELREAARKDIENLVLKIDESDYAASTKRDFKLTIRRFYKWLRETEEYPPEVRWIKARLKETKIKSPEEMLTEAEVLKIADNCRTIRDRAMVMTLYESGCRIGELMPIRIKHLCFDEYGAQMHVTGKTGYRRVRIFAAVPMLKSWLNNHPCKEDPEAYVWWCKGSFLTYPRVGDILRAAAQKAQLKKKVNPHNFRHSRATFLASHLTEAQMKEYLGWVQSSKMASIYVHLSGRDVDNSLLALYGVKKAEEKGKTSLIPISCPQCNTTNAAGGRFCTLCGTPLSEAARADALQTDFKRKEADGLLDRLSQDPEFVRMLTDKLDTLAADHPHSPQPHEANTIKAATNDSLWNEQQSIRLRDQAPPICAPAVSPMSTSCSAKKATAKSAGRGLSGSTMCGGAGNEGKD